MLFVLAVAVHAPIGLRNVLREWTPWRGRTLDVALRCFPVLLAWLRAALAVYVSPDRLFLGFEPRTGSPAFSRLCSPFRGDRTRDIFAGALLGLVGRVNRSDFLDILADHRYAAGKIRRGRHRRGARDAYGVGTSRACIEFLAVASGPA